MTESIGVPQDIARSAALAEILEILIKTKFGVRHAALVKLRCADTWKRFGRRWDMGRKSWGIYGVAIALVGLIGMSFAISPTDARGQDERAVLDDFTPTISSDDCIDSRTTAGLERPRASNWLEVAPAERHMLDIASDRAVDRGVDVPVFSSLAESAVMRIVRAVGACHGRIKIGGPRFYGEYAFVTESEKDGASTSVYRRTARGWAWVSLSANGGSVEY